MQNTVENNDSLNKNAEKECLDAIFKTTKMGIYSVNILFTKMKKNEKILNFLQKQVDFYKSVDKIAEEIAEKYGFEVYSIPLFQKLPVRCSVAMQLFCDDSESHIAKMTLKGLEMGVIELIEARNKFKGKISRECEELLATLLLRLDAFDDEMKSFL